MSVEQKLTRLLRALKPIVNQMDKDDGAFFRDLRPGESIIFIGAHGVAPLGNDQVKLLSLLRDAYDDAEGID